MITDPASSPVATRGLPIPAVSADDFVRKATVVPWTSAAAPPPAMIANVHFKNGDISITVEAVAIVPAMTAAGEVITSRT